MVLGFALSRTAITIFEITIIALDICCQSDAVAAIFNTIKGIRGQWVHTQIVRAEHAVQADPKAVREAIYALSMSDPGAGQTCIVASQTRASQWVSIIELCRAGGVACVIQQVIARHTGLAIELIYTFLATDYTWLAGVGCAVIVDGLITVASDAVVVRSASAKCAFRVAELTSMQRIVVVIPTRANFIAPAA